MKLSHPNFELSASDIGLFRIREGVKKKKSGIFQIRSDPPTHPQKSPKSGKKKIYHPKMIFRQF